MECYGPSFSPDGTKIAYVNKPGWGGYQLRTCNLDGSNDALVCDDIGFSAEAGTIANWVSGDWIYWGAGTVLYRAKADGSGGKLSVMNMNTGADIQLARVSSDGTRGAFFIHQGSEWRVYTFTVGGSAELHGTAALRGDSVRISGGGVSALLRRQSKGIIDSLSISGKTIVTSGRPARLVVETVRIADGTSGSAFPTNSFVCRDPRAILDAGTTEIAELVVESAGPIRATALIRGHVLLPHFGESLPENVTKREPAGRMPFSLRLSFYRDCGVVHGQHQIVFSGEPDCDFIARWDAKDLEGSVRRVIQHYRR